MWHGAARPPRSPRGLSGTPSVSSTSGRAHSAGERLHRSAPWLYALVGPAARALRRRARLLQDARTAREFVRTLEAGSGGDLPAASPRILLDAVCFQDPWTGIARVWRGVLPAWSASGFARHVVVLDRDRSAPRHPGFTYLDAPPVRAFAAPVHAAALQAACDAVGADLFVSTLYTSPLTTPSLQPVYDLIPEVMGWDLRAPMWRDKARAVARATALVAISDATAADLHRLYPATLGRPLHVTPLAADTPFHPAAAGEVSALRERYGLPGEYFVFVGHRAIHKNAELVMRALAGTTERSGPAVLFVGGSATLEPELANLAPHAVTRVARLTDDELRAAYAGARATLCVSHYEGFGLTILEAMACGCPVIAARSSALPEVAGDAALYVAEDDAPGLLAAMRAVGDPAVRADLVKRGLARAAGFSWERTAGLLEAAIREAAS